MKYLFIVTMLLCSCRGPEGVQGGKGDPGIPGQTIVGPTGPAGADGKDGKDGQDATPVTAIKFCDEVPTYPSSFPEYGLCLGDKLYGVYSTNGGFLAYLPDGDYRSNAVGSKCNFHVSGCVVTGL